jgi:hypothetical protein
MSLVIVTYFTDQKYADYARALLESAAALGLEAVAVKRPDLGAWKKNLSHKPEVILTAMQAMIEDDILFVDSDARMIRAPLLALEPGDSEILVYYPMADRPAGGTIFARNMPPVRSVIARWSTIMAENPSRSIPGMAWDEACLYDALKEARRAGRRVASFPPSYCWIERRMRSAYPTVDPVIEHYTVADDDSR